MIRLVTVSGGFFSAVGLGQDMRRPVFPNGIQNVAISYTAGYASLPEDLAEAIAMTAAHLHLIGNTRRLGAKSISMTGGGGGGTTSFAINDIPAEARAILDRYRAVVPR